MTPVPPVEPPCSVVIVGAGTMGSGMALAFARAGVSVTLVSRTRRTLNRALERIQETLGILTEREESPARERIVERVQTTTDLEVSFQTDLVVESVVEDLEAKRRVLRAIEARVSPKTVLTTNTSSLPISEIGSVLRHPQRFAGYHWFNPPELIELVEVVLGPRTSEEASRRLLTWSKAIGKTPILVRKPLEGFVANRLQYALLREAYALVSRGVCSLEDVDRVVTAGLGPRWAAVGPFQSMDLAGLDVHEEVVRQLFPRLSNARQVPRILRQLTASGALGTKSGRGLLGSYTPATVRALTRRRDRILLALAELRGGCE